MSNELLIPRRAAWIALSALPDDLDPAEVAARAGIPWPLSGPRDVPAVADALHRVWRAAMSLGAAPTLPFEVGLRVPFGTYEVIDYLAGACACVGVGFEKLARYFDLITTTLRWQVEGAAEPPSVTLRCNSHSPEERTISLQYALGVTFGHMNASAERPLHFVEVALAMPEPPSRAPHEDFFGCRVRYGAELTRCAFTRESWETPLVRGELGLRQVLEQHAADLLARTRSETNELRAVRMAIHERLPDGAPELGTVAQAVGMSTRTLQRRLRDAGTSFAAVVEEERSSAARAYLGDQALAVSEIAYLLGYSEASAFVRAFKRWTGKTPNQFRAAGASVATTP
ncbi:helix-turn-helix domain-containing protein [Haliangium ochraceum]|uniref:Transcriptional regulator, AraC family n=1 Tax=Haliangium ochraceum (strain DSM 14365 / JCM 11303 / SMP-2) TaxID=502025 RepID=D0LMC0_HALO1|nr:AraC family transcriptional regulator [Haliangium ochraceum]ACY16826.1 transcriptional regulator, AraC family [Haliangium ochraceum DSM 14365]